MYDEHLSLIASLIQHAHAFAARASQESGDEVQLRPLPPPPPLPSRGSLAPPTQRIVAAIPRSVALAPG